MIENYPKNSSKNSCFSWWLYEGSCRWERKVSRVYRWTYLDQSEAKRAGSRLFMYDIIISISLISAPLFSCLAYHHCWCNLSHSIDLGPMKPSWQSKTAISFQWSCNKFLYRKSLCTTTHHDGNCSCKDNRSSSIHETSSLCICGLAKMSSWTAAIFFFQGQVLFISCVSIPCISDKACTQSLAKRDCLSLSICVQNWSISVVPGSLSVIRTARFSSPTEVSTQACAQGKKSSYSNLHRQANSCLRPCTSGENLNISVSVW